MPIVVGDVANLDELTTRTIDLGRYGKDKFSYYRNRINLSMDTSDDTDVDDDDVSEEQRNQMSVMLSEVIAEWPLEGPVYRRINGKNTEVVPRGEAVGLSPDEIVKVPYPLLLAIYQGILRRESERDPKGRRR
jgi:hypothetical protein